MQKKNKNKVQKKISLILIHIILPFKREILFNDFFWIVLLHKLLNFKDIPI